MISDRHVRFPAISGICIDNATGGFGDLSSDRTEPSSFCWIARISDIADFEESILKYIRPPLFPEFHNVYVEPENFRYYQQHDKFPDGTVLVKELVLTQAGTYPDGSADSASCRGYFPSSLHGLDVMLKDSKRFGDTHDWGFFSFGHQAPPYQPTASV
jgi:hypothetical protein